MIDKVNIVTKDIITSDFKTFKGITLHNDSNCSTGDTDYLLPKFNCLLKKAKTIDLAVGFLIEELRRYSSVWKRFKSLML